jgi:hypothetical protein
VRPSSSSSCLIRWLTAPRHAIRAEQLPWRQATSNTRKVSSGGKRVIAIVRNANMSCQIISFDPGGRPGE